jgi:hypothetical protein
MAPTRVSESRDQARPRSPVTYLAQAEPRIEGLKLIVPPFRIDRLFQRFLQRSELRIDLAGLVPDVYRVLAVQNFWIEDDNPDLSQAIAGVFLARRRTDGEWEEPENWPIECRTLAVVGCVDIRIPGHAVLIPCDHEY